MSLVVLNVLCEGQTEDRFAQKVLKPYLKDFGITVKTQLLLTNRRRKIRGGMISSERAVTDLRLWIKQHGRKTSETHYFTTMFDLYKLPNDFPGYKDAHKAVDCHIAVSKLEEAFGKTGKTC